ncbi:MAG: hypothetical protein PVJ66_08975 [Gammaproteobacteria bacterium]|jgi:hypothetical protein
MRCLHRLSIILALLALSATPAAAANPGGGEIAASGCMQDLAGFELNCTANDVRVSGVADVTGDGLVDEADISFAPTCDYPAVNAGDDCSADPDICLDENGDPAPELCGDRCAYPGDTTKFSATFVFELSAQERFDVGAYFETSFDSAGDGALTGSCNVITLPETGSFERPDGSEGDYVDLDTACKGGKCPQPEDECGDIDNANNPIYYDMQGPKAVADTITAQCLDTDDDGFLNLPNCTSWRQSGANDVCLEPAQAFPGSPSKCNCDPNFQLPITVPAATLGVVKTATPAMLNEPGAVVKFDVSVTNKSPFETVTLYSLVDNVYGDIADTNNSNIGSTTCSVPRDLGPGITYSCYFMAPVTGQGGTSHTDTVTASAMDTNQNVLEGSDDATVQVLDVSPEMSVTKTASPTSVNEPGANVAFSVLVSNDSTAGSDDLTLGSLTDNVFGDITDGGNAAIISTDCSVPRTVAYNGSYSCSFTAFVGGAPFTVHEDTVTAVASDEEGNELTRTDPATVDILNLDSSCTLTKTADPVTVNEPGASVAFSIRVDNDSSVDVLTINSLTDFDFGNLDGQGDCTLPQDIAPGGSYGCDFTADVSGPGGTTQGSTATAMGVDDDGFDRMCSDSAKVDISDVAPTATLTKEAIEAVVTYRVKVANTSTIEAVTLEELGDDRFGDIADAGNPSIESTNCELPQEIAIGGDYSCTFDARVATSPHTNTVTGTVTDDEDNTVTPAPSDSATVTLD